MYACSSDKMPDDAVDCQDVVVYSDVRTTNQYVLFYISGCHDGVGQAPGNYKSYEGIQAYFDNGQFTTRTLQTRDMPPDYAVNGPKTLTIEEIELIMCWNENDYKKQ